MPELTLQDIREIPTIEIAEEIRVRLNSIVPCNEAHEKGIEFFKNEVSKRINLLLSE